ncbi:hypothetical protein Aduo_004955 [Ancylostoma duodenale]
MSILGPFNAAFTIFDRKSRPTEGTGCCCVTESIDLLGLEWCIQINDYKELREQYNCKLASAAIENARDDITLHLDSCSLEDDDFDRVDGGALSMKYMCLATMRWRIHGKSCPISFQICLSFCADASERGFNAVVKLHNVDAFQIDAHLL